MLHTVKTTCAISALLVSFAATAHAANVVADPYASYIDCSKGQVQSSGNSGCTVRGQQVTVSALSQMMAAASANTKANVRANNYNAISNYTTIVALNDGERSNVQYERGTERGINGKDREVKQLVFLIDNRPRGRDDRDAPGGNVNERGGRDAAGRDRDIRDANGRLIRDGRDSTGDRRDANGRLIRDGRNQSTASSWTSESGNGIAQAYKIELPDAVAARIEKSVPRKLERDDGVSASSRTASDRQATETWDDDDANGYVREVVIPLEYASDDEVKAEEAKAAPAATPGTVPPGTAAPVAIAPAANTSAVALAAPENANQSSAEAPLKVMILKDTRASDGMTATIRIYNGVTSEVIYANTVREDALVAYNVREVSPVTLTLAQQTSGAPGENTHDQYYSGFNNTPSGLGNSAGNQPEPMDKDNPESGKGGSGT